MKNLLVGFGKIPMTMITMVSMMIAMGVLMIKMAVDLLILQRSEANSAVTPTYFLLVISVMTMVGGNIIHMEL